MRRRSPCRYPSLLLLSLTMACGDDRSIGPESEGTSDDPDEIGDVTGTGDETQGSSGTGSDESDSTDSTGDPSDGATAGDTQAGPDLPPVCPPESVCGDGCCGEGELCLFQACVVPGASCFDAGDCLAGEICDYSLGDTEDAGLCGDAELAAGKCVPRPPDCEGEPPLDGELDCLPTCELSPELAFEPVLEHHIETLHVMMAPIVTQLDDDDCD
ncbi:MAG: hypothetical protein KC431_04500, partial [Myxococcales bacterium]|nr:hypothetical protein [Myxococcales bacterium]